MDILKRTAIAVSLVIAAVVATVVPCAVAQISPGDLAEQHAFIDGLKNCLKCHELSAGPSAKKCLECHREIAAGLDDRRGYHYQTVNVEEKTCFECHSDHAGRDFHLIRWPDGVNNFAHKLTGYELEGKHKQLKCRDCHKADLIRENLSRFGDQVNVSRTFLGLHTGCLDCHPNQHRGQLSGDCLRCHTNDGWKPAPGFDHQKTTYPLVGKHGTVACAKCHETIEKKDPAWSGSESFVRYTGLSFANCTPCHKDVHKGIFGTTCTECHNAADWRDVPETKFDHSKTRYPLLGLHAGLACAKCHAPKEKKAPLAHERCTNCHFDAHFGQLVKRADKGACESCHNVDGFIPSLFTSADHTDTRFALKGAHLAQPCVACHPIAWSPDGIAYRVFILEDTRCISCHRDVHVGQFPQKDCTACHNVEQWQRIAFDHNRDSKYKLEGEHRRVSCTGCHVETTEQGNTFVRYTPISPDCKTCHTRDDLELSPD